MELEITGLAFGGRGLARKGKEVFLVAGALPGERVRVEVSGRRRGVLEAAVQEVLSPSPWRDPSPCPLAGGICGGCDFAHVAAAFREQAYKASLLGALRGAPQALGEAVAAAQFFPSPWHYRLRGHLHWKPPRHLGFFAPRSHRVVGLEPCRVLSRPLVELLPVWAEALGRAGLPAGNLEFLEDLEARQRLLFFRGGSPPPLPPLPGVEGFWAPGGRGWGLRHLQLALPKALKVPVGAFLQGNRHLLPELWSMVCQLVKDSRAKKVADLYGGVGFFAAAAEAGGASHLEVVELARLSAQAAKENLPSARVWCTSAEEAVGQGVLQGKDLVILDPPRGGLSPGVREALLGASAPLLLYVSCDPPCLARDVSHLVGAGYQVIWARLFDLFAGTHHVELAVLLQR